MSKLVVKSITTPLRLYKFLLQNVRKLPKDAQDHYKHAIRQSYRSHSDEVGAERIQQIIQRAIEDCEWVVKKYTGK